MTKTNLLVLCILQPHDTVFFTILFQKVIFKIICPFEMALNKIVKSMFLIS